MPVSNGGYRDMPGGPARYCGEALELLGLSYRLITGDSAVVEVLPASDGQYYLIPTLPPIPLPDRLDAPAVIVSPIMQEVDPKRFPEVTGLLALDLQGFVREPMRPTNSSSTQFDLLPLVERAGVVKAARDELERLTPETRTALERVPLVVTEGSAGARVIKGEKSTYVAARPVELPHTIGAGDILLAGLVAALLEGHSIVEATVRAMRFTEDTLGARGREEPAHGESRR
jgi:hypothetical protein